MASFLRAWDLTAAQYNVLRILRGAGETGATCSQISERMISRDPDITRLLDRLEARGLLTRERGKEDRRVVMTRISPEGLRLIGGIDEPLRELTRKRLGELDKSALASLIEQLEQVRSLFENEL